MKTNFLILGLCFSAGFNLCAQEIRYGFLGGFGITQSFWTNMPEQLADQKPYYPFASFSLNTYAGFKGKGNLGISIEPGIIQKGGVDRNSSNDKSDNVRIELLYFHAPILINYYFGQRLSVSMGPELGYRISVNSHFKEMITDLSEFYDNKFELSGLVGVNYAIVENVDIGIRYSRGFTHTIKFETTSINGLLIGDVNEFNQYLHCIARYKFNSKNKS